MQRRGTAAAALVENPRARSRLAKLSAHFVESALR
jgi:hypothetical protein